MQVSVEESEGEENNENNNPSAGFSLMAQQKVCSSAYGGDLDLNVDSNSNEV